MVFNIFTELYNHYHISFRRLKKIFYLFIFRERGREGEREEENHQCVVISHATSTGDVACNPGMCPDWESNQQPFGLQASAQSTEPHQSGQFLDFYHLQKKPCTG